ncbi:nonsense-mediated mRNA decay factor SMG5 isoform X2 [Bicyclus anynana]|uniref:Nonsense-mediated mRNA decay factor SMG5 isoform X2 n=1 Tax=Bicyclus anynana TaxID=110368 RepID=A0A6J1NU77_BICAN|nr:nonsense-mediated mRNA decay factor SMG5 isoform X2 [Bicyclus anynana]
MKNGCNELLESKTTERNERAKKIYRYVNDIARRLGDTTAGSQSIGDLFTTNVETQRQKLRDNCEKLFFLDPLNYGKKSLELLWRKVYYDTVSTVKKLRESNTKYDNYIFSHIVCGIGHFHNLMIRVQSEMGVNIKELDFMPLFTEDESDEDLQINPSNEEYQLGKCVLYSCLIYLGDLSRYQVELFNDFDSSIAARYYLQAAKIDLASGMPFNQLGNLYLDRNYNLDSVCYYIHCLNTVTPFEGAMGNLTKIFEKNNQIDDIVETDSSSQVEHMQVTIANFLSLIEVWYFGKDHENIPKICNSIAQQLKIAMDFERTPLPDINKNYADYTKAIEEESINPSYMNASVIHNVVLICLFTIAKLNEVDEGKAFACKAFTLAFLSQVLQKLLKQLESFGLKSPAHKYNSRFAAKYEKEKIVESTKIPIEETTSLNETKLTNGDTNGIKKQNISEEETNKGINGEGKNNKKHSTAKRRRRRRVASSETTDDSDADSDSSAIETDKSESEGEDLSDTTYHSDNDSKSDGSLYNISDNEDLDAQVTEGSQEREIRSVGTVIKTVKLATNNGINGHKNESFESADQLQVSAIEQFLLGDNFLPSVKLLQDWVLTEKELILSCGDSGESLFQCVVDLLNIFIYYFNHKNNELLSKVKCKILDHTRVISKKFKLEFKSLPLPEDINLRGTNICKFDKDASEWQMIDKFKPTVIDENVVRILNFIDFGYQTAKIVPRIRYNRTLKVFYFKKNIPPKVTIKINHSINKNKEWTNSEKQAEPPPEGGLLRRLGHLWLTSQVHELERARPVEVPSLLAVDTATLYKHLRRVKQLVRTCNFVILVPTVVLHELDELKRDKSSARDAIRWLETELKSGSRFLRTQRPGQAKPLPFLKCPKKAPQHILNFIQILEFCNHFVTDEKPQGGNGDPDSAIHGKASSLLVLLVGNELGKEEYKEFSVQGAAKSAGVAVEYVDDFYYKWRKVIPKSGTKR